MDICVHSSIIHNAQKVEAPCTDFLLKRASPWNSQRRHPHLPTFRLLPRTSPPQRHQAQSAGSLRARWGCLWPGELAPPWTSRPRPHPRAGLRHQSGYPGPQAAAAAWRRRDRAGGTADSASRGLSRAGEKGSLCPQHTHPWEVTERSHRGREQLPAESHPHGAEQALDEMASPAPRRFTTGATEVCVPDPTQPRSHRCQPGPCVLMSRGRSPPPAGGSGPITTHLWVSGFQGNTEANEREGSDSIWRDRTQVVRKVNESHSGVPAY